MYSILLQMSKSAILRKALEYVRYLQQMNAKLQKENMALKMAAQKQSVNGLLTATMYVPYGHNARVPLSVLKRS